MADSDTGRTVPSGAGRYPLRNSSDREGTRLKLLEQLSDPTTIAGFEALGVGPGWHCAELGAGGGSMVQWLSQRVGGDGTVTAVDRDTSQLRAVETAHANVRVIEGDLCTVELPKDRFDLVHSRSVLMHLECPERVVAEAVSALRPGGWVFFEETDGAPVQELADPPRPFAQVMVPIASRWRFARGLAGLLEALGTVDVRDDVSENPLVGGTPYAAFWRYTLGSVAEVVRTGAVAEPAFEVALKQMTALLDDPSFSVPFTTRHRVRARRPT
jgi:SAM-dependent methyltransferase